MFQKILIANRGEIVPRIVAACRELGVQSVTVYSEVDADASWVRAADFAYPLGGVTATDSYLNQEKILEIAHLSGAEAIHPGYGFLSENADFAENCARHGLTFIGPTAEAMRQMGSKASAREIAHRAGVPTPPGMDGAGLDDDALAEAATQLGYPVLIKASAGGGGKGMRVVETAEAFADALQAARDEAQRSFGDDHIILEKFFTHLHHIEVQILGDEQGHIIHLGERECSVQRRHQKIIEESPSPTIDPATRQRICEAAVTLAQQVGYTSAGTVEFMYTGEGQFYLLEMNTRLQVEHPITEWVTGIDLAKWQIRIAAGEPLDLAQIDIAQRGHALECRIYAEDPALNFLPSTGTLAHVAWPQGPHVRVDQGVMTGSTVTPYYDPMLAKIITWGRDRAEAIARMTAALEETAVLGVTTNLSYLLDILRETHFQQGETPTRYLADHFANWSNEPPLDEALWLAIAAFEALQGRQRPRAVAADSAPTTDPWHMTGRWRNV